MCGFKNYDPAIALPGVTAILTSPMVDSDVFSVRNISLRACALRCSALAAEHWIRPGLSEYPDHH